LNRGSAPSSELLPDVWKASHPEAVRTYREVERRDKADRARLRNATRRLLKWSPEQPRAHASSLPRALYAYNAFKIIPSRLSERDTQRLHGIDERISRDNYLVATRHIDVVFYQMFGRWDEQHAALERWRTLTSKPFFNGDSSFATPSEQMPNPHGPHARNAEECGELAFEFGRNAFAQPDFVGWTVCGWVETWMAMKGKEQKQHSGFFMPLGDIHEPYVRIRRLRELSEKIYHFGQHR
jgi:hypothetical protein